MMKNIIFLVQAIMLCRRYGVSIGYMRAGLVLEYRRQHEQWRTARYHQELLLLGMKYPKDVEKHMEALEQA